MTSPIKLIAVLAALTIGAFLAVLSMPVRKAPEARFAVLQGQSIATSELRGRVAIVNFWSTSCGPCIAEMPELVQTFRSFGPQGLEVIAVASRRDPPEQVARFAAQRALPFKVALDPAGDVAKKFGNVHITPTLFVVDREGRVIRRFQGTQDWTQVRALVARALART